MFIHIRLGLRRNGCMCIFVDVFWLIYSFRSVRSMCWLRKTDWIVANTRYYFQFDKSSNRLWKLNISLQCENVPVRLLLMPLWQYVRQLICDIFVRKQFNEKVNRMSLNVATQIGTENLMLISRHVSITQFCWEIKITGEPTYTWVAKSAPST